MDSGVPLASSFSATSPMTFTYFTGMNSSSFHNGLLNYDTQSMSCISNHFPLDMLNIASSFPSSPFPAYMNLSFGSGGTMAPLSTSSFDRSHVPQPTLIMGGWNLPSYESNLGLILIATSAQMGGYYTYYTPSVYPSPTMLVPTNTLPMAGPHMSSGISCGGNQFYSMGYPLHETPSHGGNTYPPLNNPYNTFIPSQTYASVMIHVQTYMDQLGRGYYLSR
jgi:hypothetical protein